MPDRTHEHEGIGGDWCDFDARLLRCIDLTDDGDIGLAVFKMFACHRGRTVDEGQLHLWKAFAVEFERLLKFVNV